MSVYPTKTYWPFCMMVTVFSLSSQPSWKVLAFHEENKQGIEGKSRTSTQFITFEEYTCMADKADKCLDAIPSRSLFTALYIICMTTQIYQISAWQSQ